MSERLLVVKLGSSSVTREAGPDTTILADALEQAMAAREDGWRVILVSSGAQSVGRALLGIPVSPKVAAAVGQPALMDFYRDHAAPSAVCQVLVGASDLRSQRRMAAITAVLTEALDHGIIPIVNGNDPADDEKTNNDLVAAGIAIMSRASHLLLLTDVPGVYADLGRGEPLAELALEDMHRIRTAGEGSGTGGIRSKLRAAEVAARNGVETRIASARDHSAIAAVVGGRPVGTLVRRTEHLSTRRIWVSGGAVARGSVRINLEAEASIAEGSSLFASGIKAVKGDFVAGDVIEVLGPHGRLLGRGVTRVSSGFLTLVRALRVDEIALIILAILGRQPAADPGPRVAGALAHLDALTRDAQRALVREAITLFPEDAASALTGTRDVSASMLRQHYAALVAGLAVIHNDQLVDWTDHRRGSS